MKRLCQETSLIFSLRMNSNFEVKDIAKSWGQQTWHPVEALWVFTYWSQIIHNSKHVDQLTRTHKTSPTLLGNPRLLFYARHDEGMFYNAHALNNCSSDWCNRQPLNCRFWFLIESNRPPLVLLDFTIKHSCDTAYHVINLSQLIQGRNNEFYIKQKIMCKLT